MGNEEKPSYYAIIPADVRYDKDLNPNAKLLYGEITALSNKDGYCYASNSYFGNLYNVSNRTIIEWLNCLKNKNYITTEIVYKDGSKEILSRYIKLFGKGSENFFTRGSEKNFTGVVKKTSLGSEKNFTDNNININNTSINKENNIFNSLHSLNILKESSKKTTFTKPTIEEIKLYCQERNNNVNAESFYDFYESKGWLIGKSKMKDWKAAVRTWEKRTSPTNGYKQPKKTMYDVLKEMEEEMKREEENDKTRCS